MFRTTNLFDFLYYALNPKTSSKFDKLLQNINNLGRSLWVADIMSWASAEACTGGIRLQLTTDGSYSGNSPFEVAAPITVDVSFTA